MAPSLGRDGCGAKGAGNTKHHVIDPFPKKVDLSSGLHDQISENKVRRSTTDAISYDTASYSCSTWSRDADVDESILRLSPSHKKASKSLSFSQGCSTSIRSAPDNASDASAEDTQPYENSFVHPTCANSEQSCDSVDGKGDDASEAELDSHDENACSDGGDGGLEGGNVSLLVKYAEHERVCDAEEGDASPAFNLPCPIVAAPIGQKEHLKSTGINDFSSDGGVAVTDSTTTSSCAVTETREQDPGAGGCAGIRVDGCNSYTCDALLERLSLASPCLRSLPRAAWRDLDAVCDAIVADLNAAAVIVAAHANHANHQPSLPKTPTPASQTSSQASVVPRLSLPAPSPPQPHSQQPSIEDLARQVRGLQELVAHLVGALRRASTSSSMVTMTSGSPPDRPTTRPSAAQCRRMKGPSNRGSHCRRSLGREGEPGLAACPAAGKMVETSLTSVTGGTQPELKSWPLPSSLTATADTEVAGTIETFGDALGRVTPAAAPLGSTNAGVASGAIDPVPVFAAVSTHDTDPVLCLSVPQPSPPPRLPMVGAGAHGSEIASRSPPLTWWPPAAFSTMSVCDEKQEVAPEDSSVSPVRAPPDRSDEILLQQLQPEPCNCKEQSPAQRYHSQRLQEQAQVQKAQQHLPQRLRQKAPGAARILRNPAGLRGSGRRAGDSVDAVMASSAADVVVVRSTSDAGQAAGRSSRRVVFGDDPAFHAARKAYIQKWRANLQESNESRWVRRLLAPDIAADPFAEVWHGASPTHAVAAWAAAAAAASTAASTSSTAIALPPAASPTAAMTGGGAATTMPTLCGNAGDDDVCRRGWCTPRRRALYQERMVDAAVDKVVTLFVAHGAPLGLTKLAPYLYGLDSRRLRLKMLPDGRLAVRCGGGWEELTLALAKLPLPRDSAARGAATAIAAVPALTAESRVAATAPPSHPQLTYRSP
ncbi:hypothetical protein VaNZ11_008177 [Volvox africanus]|uniref:GAR domain-containing protein n=1 Tax=Volvox africanus TaxID=51714 RepID=A0ABQ5S5R1_9CHLO|nr:hypothetical protein VaNZ11_008177 [Volvox africanus]